jgi:hypothetical protein
MNLSYNFNQLKRLSNEKLNSFQYYFDNKVYSNADEYQKCISSFLLKNEIIEFTFLDYQFYLKTEPKYTQGITYFKTYLVETDEKNYPPQKRLVHWEDLDLIIAISGYVDFRKKIKTIAGFESPSIKGYFYRLYNIIVAIEAENVKIIEDKKE